MLGNLTGKSCLKLIVNCIFASIQVFSTSMGMMWVTLNMPSAANRQGISHCLEIGHPVRHFPFTKFDWHKYGLVCTSEFHLYLDVTSILTSTCLLCSFCWDQMQQCLVICRLAWCIQEWYPPQQCRRWLHQLQATDNINVSTDWSVLTVITCNTAWNGFQPEDSVLAHSSSAVKKLYFLLTDGPFMRRIFQHIFSICGFRNSFW